jgi:hypothetical protein
MTWVINIETFCYWKLKNKHFLRSTKHTVKESKRGIRSKVYVQNHHAQRNTGKVWYTFYCGRIWLGRRWRGVNGSGADRRHRILPQPDSKLNPIASCKLSFDWGRINCLFTAYGLVSTPSLSLSSSETWINILSI